MLVYIVPVVHLPDTAGRRKHQRVGMDWTADVCPLILPISPGMRHIARVTRPSGKGMSALGSA